MGIHSDWIKTFKSEVPGAFTDNFSGRVAAGFVDGQIQLMKSRGIVSWDQFVQYQFVFPLRRLLREHGATVVVLAFDDYDHVPAAKSMTQAKRAKRADPVQFHSRDQLPSLIPDYWDRAILNRNFKTRVIQLVITRLPALLGLADKETLIIDYKGPPQVFGAQLSIEGFGALGEADLKFFRYAERFGSLLAVTTDSDYIPIALLRLEAIARNGGREPRVVIRRLRVGEANGDAKDTTASKARAVEFVNANILRRELARLMWHSGVCGDDPDDFSMTRLCSLIALFGGTDFSRGMPQIGPKRVWPRLCEISHTLLRAFDTDRGLLREDIAQQQLVPHIYGRVFIDHARGHKTLQGVFGALQRSKLSARTKAQLPSPEYIDTSVRNANWIVLYWGGDMREEDAEFGYRWDGRRVTYADL